MTVPLTGFRVFIATPGGLDDVRRRFYERLIRFNHEDANERGVSFIPYGWELTLAGRGRPQSQINEEVSRSDYMVLVLSDRWGTPPSSDGSYTSGTEEEYNIARRCLEDPDMPMKNIAVMFQGVDSSRLTDPGDQLKKVLAFKERLEEERWLLFTTFDSPQEFENDLLAQLLRWMRDHERGGDAQVMVPPPSSWVEGGSSRAETVATDPGMTLLDQAKEFAREGRFTRAESLYARAVAGSPDVEALTQYTRFLRRAGRLERAFSVSERLLEIGRATNDPAAEIEALSNRGIIARKRGRYAASIGDFEAALVVAREMGSDGRANEAFLLDNIALTRRKEGRFRDALTALEQSLEIRRTLDDQRGLANSLNNVGALRRQLGDLEAARIMHEQAVELFRELGDTRGEANARANLGEVLDATGDSEAAKREFEESLEINESLKSHEGIGMNCWQLGRVALEAGDFPSARRYAFRCLSFDERAPDRPESVGGAFHLFGQIELAEGDYATATQSFERALSIYTATGQRLGAAWTAGDLARARSAAGDQAGAQEALALALSTGRDQDHAQLAASLRVAESAIAAASTGTFAST